MPSMSDYTELVKALRHCAESTTCNKCPQLSEFCCVNSMMKDAANAIDALQADNAEMLHELEDAAKQIRELQDEVLSYVSDSQPHWVSVEERLPNVGELVVGLDEDGHAELTMLSESKSWLTYGLWIHNLGCYVWWMPLPEPPQEVQE